MLNVYFKYVRKIYLMEFWSKPFFKVWKHSATDLKFYESFATVFLVTHFYYKIYWKRVILILESLTLAKPWQ